MLPKIKLVFIAGFIALTGCGAQARYARGLNKGYKQALAFQQSQEVKPEYYAIGIYDGWRKAYDPKDIEARQLAAQKESAEYQQKELDRHAEWNKKRIDIGKKMGLIPAN